MRSLPLVLLQHPEKPIEENSHENVKCRIHPQHSKGHAPLRVISPEICKELICLGKLAVSTVFPVANRARIDERTAVVIDIAAHVLSTALILRRKECHVFIISAVHRCPSETGREESGGEICERIGAVYLPPEVRHCGWGNEQPAESGTDEDEESGSGGGNFDVIETRDQHVSEHAGPDEGDSD